MAIKAVVFDIGGVLELTETSGVSVAFAAWERRLGLEPGAIGTGLGDVWSAGVIGALSEAAVRERLRTGLALDATQLDAFMEDVWTEYLGTPNTDLVEYFRALRPRFKTALLSNSFVGAREREQARYGFAELCDVIVYSHEAKCAKPDERVYRLVCERLQVRPEEAVFLDDSAVAVEGARAVGMHTVTYLSNPQAIAEIEALVRQG